MLGEFWLGRSDGLLCLKTDEGGQGNADGPCADLVVGEFAGLHLGVDGRAGYAEEGGSLRDREVLLRLVMYNFPHFLRTKF